MEQKTKNNVQILIGLAIGLFCCLFLWGARTVEYKSITYFVGGIPNSKSGIFALMIIAFSVWRGILGFQAGKKWINILIFIVDMTIFSTVFSLLRPESSSTSVFGLFEMMKKDAFYTVVITFCITMLAFGMKNLAKVALFITPILIFSRDLSIISEALKFRGYLALVGIVVCFIMQNSINSSAVKRDLSILYGESNKAIVGAAQEAKAIGDAVVDTGKKTVEVASKMKG